MDRIPSSIATGDKSAIRRIADEKRVSIAWVIRDAVSRYLSLPEHAAVLQKSEV